MKLIVLLALSLTIAVARFASAADEGHSGEHHGPMYHVVSIKFKPDTKPEEIKKVEDAFVGLKEKIPGILTLHWGTNVSPEKRDHGFTHCFVLTFAKAADRDGYLTDPAHKAFGKLAGPYFADVMVIDFESEH
jgi:hypothetical protein